MRLLALLLLASAFLVPDARAQQARTDTEVIRTWSDDVKVDGRTEARRIEIAFDYAQGVTLRRTYGAGNSLLRTEVIEGQPQPSPAEIAEATAIVAADAELAPLLSASEATIEGGFTYDGQDFERPLAACGPGTRCLQFDLVAPSRTESVRFVVVDLATRRVVERDLFPNL